MECRRLSSTIPNPGQGKRLFATLLKSERYTGKNGGECAHLAGGSNNAVMHTADMKVLAFARRVRSAQTFPKHVGNRYSHFVACAGVSYHGSDFIGLAIERMDVADGYGFLTSAEPGLGKDSLPDPATECNIMESEAQHTRVQAKKLFLIKLRDDGPPLTIPVNCIVIFLADRGIGSPCRILWRVKQGITLHFA